MMPAWHLSGIEETKHTVGASPASFVIDSGMTVYHAGNTDLFSDMKLIGTLFRPKVALLPIGGCYTMGPIHAAIAVEWVGAVLRFQCSIIPSRLSRSIQKSLNAVQSNEASASLSLKSNSS